MAAGFFVSCRKRDVRTLYIPAGRTEISVALSFPFDAVTGSASTLSEVCADAQSFLLTLDLDTAGAVSPDYRFLFGLDGTLYGCGNGACSSQNVAKSLSAPHRVIVEGINVAPGDYSATSAFDVVCRGVADDTIPMGQISSVAHPTPSAAPSPSDVLALSVSVTVPILRIGAVNGTFANDGPSSIEVMAAPLGTPPSVRTPDGGKIAAAGGETPYSTTIYLFDPRSIGFSAPASMSTIRFVGSATGVVDSGGRAAVVFAGGMDLGSGPASLEIWDGSSPGTRVLPLIGGKIRYYHSAVFVPTHQEQGGTYPVVALLGGEDDAGYTPSYEFFYPRTPPDLSGCASGSASGSAGVCRPSGGTAMGDGGHALAVSGGLMTPAGYRVFVGPGDSPSGFIGNGFLFDPETQTYSTISGVGPATFGAATVSLSSNLLAYFGGGTASGPSSSWFLVRGSTGTQAAGIGSMKLARPAPLAVLLADSRVFIAGGNVAFEEFIPNAVSMTSGSFSFLAAPPSGVCTTGSEAGCVRSRTARASYVAVKIDGSRTWLNGAIVLAGDAPHAEIYVPAYNCAGTVPVRVSDDAPISAVDFCDRLRARQPLTNPESPARVSE